MSGQRAAVTGTIAGSVSAAASRDEQRHLVPPAPPDDQEKYSYLERNLVYLTTVIFVGSVCLVISQLRFEHVSAVLAKLGVPTRAAAASQARRLGLASPAQI